MTFHVSSSPHVRGVETTSRIMFDVVIALLPTTLWGIYWFGLNAFLVIVASVASAVLAEYLYEKLMKKKLTVRDGSAIVTGLLIGLNMPPEVPLWIPILGSFFAIIVVKQLYGGIGQNFMNPALAARCFLVISFAKYMTNFTVDAVSTATPLYVIKTGGEFDLLDMFIGRCGGTIGEVSALAILIGAAYLLVRRVISVRIPLSYILSFLVFELIFSGRGLDAEYYLAQIFGGGLMIGAWFMATDYVTSPITKVGQIVYGIIIGVLTGIFRIYGNSAEGVSFAIIITNLLVPFIEKFTQPVPFGMGRKQFSFEKKGGKA
ncbi:MAG: RnfABCDGE type electron transport complex subunit D [Lachnospiraceae bacterium]|nr:RnfABCDGE type electron transport complex subunit D [Lachnospiraceae bacterium]